ncbi:MAG: 3-dehydroquinate synthase [Actinomycetota bacterium]|nr:3-dehydroquinate synthase [Actinomycetota bacterium]MDZ4178285.1 3-dehydroquinate synthase [Coriobacteriia bacterium]
MTEIRVELPSASYDVRIGPDLLCRVGAVLAPLTSAGRAAIITDSNVDAHFGATVTTSLETAGIASQRFVVEPGERSKSWAVAGDLLEQLAAAGFERRDPVVALGGGVIGDLAGFCAGVYLRGVPFMQVPTTLLAQVDSSVGGKTAVDLEAGKNLAGAFVQPMAVVADTETLASLPNDEWLSGLAEIAKSAVLDGSDFFEWLETHAGELLERDAQAIDYAVASCVRFKARVVASDVHESGPRESLNLGHTLGHAFEKVAGYGVMSHGAAVASGMRFAARLAVRLGASTSSHAARQERLLDLLGLTHVAGGFESHSLLSAMATDKKVREGKIRFVVSTGPGTHIVTPVDAAVLAEEIQAFVSDQG